MKKTLSILAIIGLSVLFLGCTSTTNEEPQPEISEENLQIVEDQIEAAEEAAQAETVTLLNDGVEITFTPSAEDWCGDNCVVYPENDHTYVREDGDDLFRLSYDGPEISEEEQQMVQEQIEAAEEKYGDQ
ncbi:hypothetical protein HN748_04225 [Candidatus Peregrinibacteria bacterium]|jgi:hypothetical protein|nr:hypothetical protein [Candidatus Peregrinibacteria bacterium]MBT7484339.1 hypothetical protein [Candidatus Peregrinibacteria bacterium]MBT7703417.1 hypothetical protein [Candidatus Peregrinibacteria bacterium]